MTAPVLIDGTWREAATSGTFRALDPDTGEAIGDEYPVSESSDVEAAIEAGARAAEGLLDLGGDARAAFLERYAERVETRSEEIVEWAHAETALPVNPRLADIELPRTTGQLRQAASAARTGSWTLPTIDTDAGIRSMYGPLGGPVAVFGPNNFPLAFNGISGGDFAAAIGAGNPVIAKGHPSHPTTCRLLAEEALAALGETGLPAATVQLIYRTSHADGALLVSHPKVAATGYTGSRAAALALKSAADAAGKPIYLEMSSINPVFLLPGALAERGEAIAEDLAGSALMGTGQFCTNPGIVVLRAGEDAEALIGAVAERYGSSDPTALLGAGGVDGLESAVGELRRAGAELIVGGERVEGRGCRFGNTLLRTSGERFLADPEALQTEAFGNANLFVVVDDDAQMTEVAGSFEGNLTGSIYTASDDSDDSLYAAVARPLRRRVGRLLNDKMPTGVAVTAAMNHGGPYPATGHPGFTAVGIPASLRRFAMLECYDNVRDDRLPAELRDANPDPDLWRLVDGRWTTDDIG